MIDGRIDLRGFGVQQPSVAGEVRNGFVRLEGLTQIKGVVWRDIDFSDADLRELRLFGVTIDNCRFDRADLSGTRMWSTTILHSTFRGARLRDVSMGGIDTNGRRNRFEGLDFQNADLRGSAQGSSDMTRCLFRDTNLEKVEFRGTVFRDCTFEGLLDEVIFSKYAFRGEARPPNEMRNVDFSKASFQWVEFRKLDLDTVRFPENPDHFVIEDYLSTLDALVARWRGKEDAISRALCSSVTRKRKWAGDGQNRGVVARYDLLQAGGEAAVREFLTALRPGD